MSFSERRVDALLHHEVGTHVVTWYNGQSQRLTLMRTGLPGYDEVQEGLAVLAEWMVGGLTAGRLRLLAARVLALRRAVGRRGVPRHLPADPHRGPGLRAAGVLRDRAGLPRRRVRQGRRLSPGARPPFSTIFAAAATCATLLTGKIALDHVGLIQELQRRRILKPPALLPRWLEAPSNPLERAVEDRMTVLAIAEGARA